MAKSILKEPEELSEAKLLVRSEYHDEWRIRKWLRWWLDDNGIDGNCIGGCCDCTGSLFPASRFGPKIKSRAQSGFSILYQFSFLLPI